MRKVTDNIKPIDYYNARKEYLETIDALMIAEFRIKKQKKELLKRMNDWDKKLMEI